VRTLAVLPVKGFGAAKQRLSSMLGSGSRQALAQAMYADVLASLRHVSGLSAIAVVTGDRLAESTALGHRVAVLPDREQAGQSEAALIGVRYALAGGFERVLLVPADTPLLDPAEVDLLLVEAEERALDVVIVPDRHGTGTNALLLRPPDALGPSFGPGSLERHLAEARNAGLSCALESPPTLLLDVDTPDDLAELAGRLDGLRGRAPLTRGALAQLDRSRVRGPSAQGRRQPAPVRA
jgi:2-phospho-L-lactate guanylyltransferase